MSKQKQFHYLIGTVVSLEAGNCAIIHHSGRITRTSTVLEILKQRDGMCLFETRNSLYFVSAPKPTTAIQKLAIPNLVLVGSKYNTEPRDIHPSALSLKGTKKVMAKKRHRKHTRRFISDNLNSLDDLKPIRATDELRFHCSKCGDCCRHVKDSVMLETLDLFRLTRYMRDAGHDVTMESVLSEYAHPVFIAPQIKLPVFVLNTMGKEDRCVFLIGNRCTVHNGNPRACRTYPFGATPGDSDDFDYSIVSQKPHHFSGKTINVGEWMQEHMSVEDREFVRADTESFLGAAVLLGTQIDTVEDTRALRHYLFFKYFNYDLDMPFLPQFTQNMASLRNALSKGVNDDV